MVKVSKYLKNVTKSLGYAFYELTKDDYDSVAEFGSTNSELFKQAYSDLKNYKTTYQRIVTQFKNSKVFIASKEGIKAIKEDLRTGDFYNKARQDAFTAKYGGNLMSDDDWDIGEFGFDDSSDWEIDDGDELVAKATTKANKLSSILISDTIARTSEAQIDNAREIASIQYSQNIELTKTINKNIENLGMNIDNRMKDFASMSKVNSDNAIKFYSETGNVLKGIAEDIKLLADTERKRQDPNYGKKAKEQKKGDDIEDIASGGIVDLREYGKKIKKNTVEAIEKELGLSLSMFSGGGMMEGGNMLATFAANPLQELISKPLVESFLNSQSELRYNLANLNESIKGLFPALMARANTMADKDEYDGGKRTWQLLGKIFGIKNKYKTNIETKSFNKGAISWDGVSKKYLEEVIPYYLRKMTSALTGEREKVYDPDSGRWVDYGAYRENFAKSQYYRGNNALAEFRGQLENFIKDIRFIGDGNGYKDQKGLKEDLDKIARYIYAKGDIDFKDKTGSNIGVSDTSLDIFRAALDSVDNKTRMNIISNINSQKRQASEQLKRAEEEGGILYKLVSEGIDINRYSTNEYQNTKNTGINTHLNGYGELDVKGSNSPIIKGMLKVEDKYGNTLFDYLKGFKDEFEYVRKNGMYTYGETFVTNMNSPVPPSTPLSPSSTFNVAVVGENGEVISQQSTPVLQNYVPQKLNIKFLSDKEKELHKKLDMSYKTPDKKASEKELDWEENNRVSYNNKTKSMQEAAKNKSSDSTNFVNLSEQGGYNQVRNHIYEQAKLDRDKQKQEWLDERNKDSVIKDILGMTQDRVYREKYKDDDKTSFSDKFSNADTIGEKLFLVRDRLRTFMDKPSDMLNQAVVAADNHIYNMLYKSSTKMVDEDGKPIEGFLDLLKFQVTSTFRDIKNNVSETFNDMREKFKQTRLYEWWEETKTNIFGEQTGKGYRSFLSPIMEALEKNSEDVFNMYKEAFKKSLEDSGAIREDEDGKYTFKSVATTSKEKYEAYTSNARDAMDKVQILDYYRKSNPDLVESIKNMDDDSREKLKKINPDMAKHIDRVMEGLKAEKDYSDSAIAAYEYNTNINEETRAKFREFRANEFQDMKKENMLSKDDFEAKMKELGDEIKNTKKEIQQNQKDIEAQYDIMNGKDADGNTVEYTQEQKDAAKENLKTYQEKEKTLNETLDKQTAESNRLSAKSKLVYEDIMSTNLQGKEFEILINNNYLKQMYDGFNKMLTDREVKLKDVRDMKKKFEEQRNKYQLLWQDLELEKFKIKRDASLSDAEKEFKCAEINNKQTAIDETVKVILSNISVLEKGVGTDGKAKNLIYEVDEISQDEDGKWKTNIGKSTAVSNEAKLKNLDNVKFESYTEKGVNFKNELEEYAKMRDIVDKIYEEYTNKETGKFEDDKLNDLQKQYLENFKRKKKLVDEFMEEVRKDKEVSEHKARVDEYNKMEHEYNLRNNSEIGVRLRSEELSKERDSLVKQQNGNLTNKQKNKAERQLKDINDKLASAEDMSDEEKQKLSEDKAKLEDLIKNGKQLTQEEVDNFQSRIDKIDEDLRILQNIYTEEEAKAEKKKLDAKREENEKLDKADSKHLAFQSFEKILSKNKFGTSEEEKKKAKDYNESINAEVKKFKELKKPEDTMASGGINKTGKPFLSAVSSGEYINGMRVPDGGPYLTTIPKDAVVVNPASRAVQKKQAKQESKFLNHLKGIRKNAETNEGLVPARRALPEPIENLTKKFGENFGADGIAKGILGMGASGLLLGMPLLGAGLGMGTALIEKNEELNQTLFGTITKRDENGKPTDRANDGIVSDTILKAFPDAKAYGLTGSILGMLTPFGPLGGLLIGAGLGFAKNTEIVKDELLGVGAPFSEENRAKLKKALPRMGLGALAGIMFGPLGLIPNALLGGAAGFVTTTDKFKDFMFGEEDASGKREGGFVGALKQQVLSPLGELVKDIGSNIKDTLYNDFLTPIVKLIPTLTNELKHFFTESLMTIPNLIKEAIDAGLKNPIAAFLRDHLLNPMKKLVGGVLKFGMNVIKSPFTLVGKGAKALKGSLDRKAIRGGYSKMTAAERNDERRKHKFSFAMHNASPFGKDKYAAMDENLEHVANASSIDQLNDLKLALEYNVNDEKGLKKALMQNQADISKEISSQFKVNFAGGEAKKIERALRDGKYAKAKQLITTLDTVNGGRLSNEQASNMISKIDALVYERENMQNKMKGYMSMDDKAIGNLAESMGMKGIKDGKLSAKQKKQLISMLGVEIEGKKKQKRELGEKAYGELESIKQQIEAQNENTQALKSFTEVLSKALKDTHDIMGIEGKTTKQARQRLNVESDDFYKSTDWKLAEIDDEIKGYDQNIAAKDAMLENPDLSDEDRAKIESERLNFVNKRKQAKKRQGHIKTGMRKYAIIEKNMKARFNYQDNLTDQKLDKFKEKQSKKYIEPLKSMPEYSQSFDALEQLTDPAYEKHAIVLNDMAKKGNYVKDVAEFLKASDSELDLLNAVGQEVSLSKEDMYKVITLSKRQVASLCNFLKKDPNMLSNTDVGTLRGILAADKQDYKDSDIKKVQLPPHSVKSKISNGAKVAVKGISFGVKSAANAPYHLHNERADLQDADLRRELIAEIRKLTVGQGKDVNRALTTKQINAMKTRELQMYLDDLRNNAANIENQYITGRYKIEGAPEIQESYSSDDTREMLEYNQDIPEDIPGNAFTDKLLTPIRAIDKFLYRRDEAKKQKLAKKMKDKAFKDSVQKAKEEFLNKKEQDKASITERDNAEAKFLEKKREEKEILLRQTRALEQIVENTETTADNTDTTPEKGSKEQADAKVKENKLFGIFNEMKEKLTRISHNTEDEEDISPIKESFLSKAAKIFGKVLFFGKLFGGVPLLVGLGERFILPFIKEKFIPALIGKVDATGQYVGGIISPIANAISAKIGDIKERLPEIMSAIGEKIKWAMSEIGETWAVGAEAIMNKYLPVISDFMVGTFIPRAVGLLCEHLPNIIIAAIQGAKKGIKNLFGTDKSFSTAGADSIDTSLSNKAKNEMGISTPTQSAFSIESELTDMNNGTKVSNISELTSVARNNINTNLYEQNKGIGEQYITENLAEEAAANEQYQSVQDKEVQHSSASGYKGKTLRGQMIRSFTNSAALGINMAKPMATVTKGVTKLTSHIPGLKMPSKFIGKIADLSDKAGGYGAKLARFGKNAAADVAEESLEDIAARSASRTSRMLGGAVENTAEAATKGAKGGKLMTKIKDWLTNIFDGIGKNKKIVGKAAEAAGEAGKNPKFAARFAAAMKKFGGKIIDKIGRESIEKIAKIAAKITPIIGWVLILGDFVAGWDNCRNILGIVDAEVGPLEKLFAGLCNVVSGLFPVPIFGADDICNALIEVFDFFGIDAAEEIKKKQEEAEEAINLYNIKNGTDFKTVEEFNNAVNPTMFQKFKSKINDSIDKAFKGSKAYEKYKEEKEELKDASFGKKALNVAKNTAIALIPGYGAYHTVNRLLMHGTYKREMAENVIAPEEEEDIATNAETNDKLTSIKSMIQDKGEKIKSVIKSPLKHIKEMITNPIETIEEDLFGTSIAEKLEALNNLNNSIRAKIASGKLTSADKEYWKIKVNNESSFAASLFKLSEFMQRAIKSPLLIIQNAIDSVLSGETDGAIENKNSSNNNATNNAATKISNTSSGNTSTSTKNISKKSGISIAAGIASSLAKVFFGKGNEEDKSEIKHLKLSYAVKPKALLDEQVSYLKGQYSGGSNEEGHLYQRDYNDRFNISGDSNKQTIGDSGCGPVVASQVLQRLGKKYDVKEAAKAALKYKEQDGGTYPEYFGDYLGKHGVGTQNINSKSEIYNKLSSGKSVILMGQSGTGRTPFGSASPHYVLATGMSGKNVIIQDPEDPRANALYDAKSTINDSIYAINTTDTGMGRGIFNKGRLSGRGNIINANGMSDAEEQTLLNILYEIILKGESGADRYSAVNANDNGSYSVGAIQFHGTLARDMLLKMAERIPDVDDRQFITDLANNYNSTMNDSETKRFKEIVAKYPQIAQDVQDAEAFKHFTEVNLSKPIEMYNAGKFKNPISMIVPADITNSGTHNGWADTFVNNTNGGPQEVDAITNHMLTNSWWAESTSQYRQGWLNRIKSTGDTVRNITLASYVPGSIMGDSYTGFSSAVSGTNGSNGSSGSNTANTLIGRIGTYVADAMKSLYGGLYEALFGTVETNDTSDSVSGQPGAGAFNGLVAETTADGWFAATLENSSMSSGYRTSGRPDHAGIDYAAPAKTKIFCPVDGVVVYSGWNTGGYGNLVIVQDTHGYYHIFGHQYEASPLTVGQEVLRSDYIGLVGNTGESFGDHLHYQVNKPTDMWHADVDPNTYPNYAEYAENAKKRQKQANVDTINNINPDANLTVDSSSTDMVKAIQQAKNSTASSTSGSGRRSGKSTRKLTSGTSKLMSNPDAFIDSLVNEEEVSARARYAPGAKSGTNRQNIGGGTTITTDMIVAIINLLGNISTNTHRLNEVVDLLSKLSIANAQAISGTSNKKKSGKAEQDTTDDIMNELLKVLSKSTPSGGLNYGMLNSKLNPSNDFSAIDSVYQIARQ